MKASSESDTGVPVTNAPEPDTGSVPFSLGADSDAAASASSAKVATGGACWVHCLRPARPWTRAQTVVSFVLGASVCAWGSARLHVLNRERARDIDPDSGASAEIVCVVAFLLTVVYMSIVAVVSKRCHSNVAGPPLTVRETLSIHSVPYQLALGACGMIYMWVWITRMHGTKIVDIRHCNRGQTFRDIDEVIRLQHPTIINWTAVDNCDIGTILKPHELRAMDQSGIKPPRPTWFTVSNVDRLLSWREHLIDQAMTLVFFTHLVVHGMLHWLDGWYGETAFSWIAPFTNPLTVIDMLVVGSVLFATSTENNIRDAYSIGGTLRVFLLFHPLFCIQWYLQQRKKRKEYGRISHGIAISLAVLKLLFVCFLGAMLMYMSEQPCEVVLDDYRNRNGTCDLQFRTFGHVVYFTFVTLSTVGYGDMSPQTPLGRILVVFVILFGISYLPSAIADILHMGQKVEEAENKNTSSENEESSTTALQRVLDDLRRELKKRDELLLQSLAIQQLERQVGFFQHAGTLGARGNKPGIHSSSSNTSSSSGAEDSDHVLAKAALQDMAHMFAERRTQLSGEEENKEQKGEMSGHLFNASCARLRRMHGDEKIAQCMALLGLEEQGAGVAVFVDHVLGLTARHRESAGGSLAGAGANEGTGREERLESD